MCLYWPLYSKDLSLSLSLHKNTPFMAAFNDATFSLAYEKGKESNLSERELNSIDSARTKLKVNGAIGGLSGAAAGFFMSKQKKLYPFQIFLMSGVGYFMGSQMGMLIGAISAIREFKTLPDPEKVVQVIKDAQRDLASGKAKHVQPQTMHRTMAPMDASIDEKERSQLDLHEPMPMDTNLHYESEFQKDESPISSWGTTSKSSTFTEKQNTPDHVSSQKQPSVWDEIRAKNTPNTTWNKLRTQAEQNPNVGQRSPEERREAFEKRLKEQEFGTEHIPRTREETEERTSVRKNQWGDAL
ncbi:hypothetical protein BDF14DRAFT_1759913 [Spinellus fusiger]|nr:hypothetical protein BDF14DRAFT_1759913 [Spinellus fusiger]